MQGTAHQRCRVHFIRNVLAHVAKCEGEVAAVFRTIFAQPDLASMAKQWDKVRDELTARYLGSPRWRGRGPTDERHPRRSNGSA